MDGRLRLGDPLVGHVALLSRLGGLRLLDAGLLGRFLLRLLGLGLTLLLSLESIEQSQAGPLAISS